jgi:hypothetical protein
MTDCPAILITNMLGAATTQPIVSTIPRMFFFIFVLFIILRLGRILMRSARPKRASKQCAICGGPLRRSESECPQCGMPV